MTIQLPKAIEAFFAADRIADPDAIAEAFIETGIMKDRGETHRGRAAIRAFMAAELKQYSYTTEPFFIASENGRTQVTCHVVGTFPGSPIDLRYMFVLEGDKVAELEVTV